MFDVDAIAFDLLTALLDSWSLWGDVVGDDERGRAWRIASLRKVTSAGIYQPYEVLVAEAAREVGLPGETADYLFDAWGELKPWPEVPAALSALRGRPLAVVTNCSDRLAHLAAGAVGVPFDIIVSAERAGAYKPDPRPYRLALRDLGLPAKRVLFVAGSAHDVPGAAGVGMPVLWANRLNLPTPEGAHPALVVPDLSGLPNLLKSTR